MAYRHPRNTNLSLHTDPVWQGFPVNISAGPLIHEYLEGIHAALQTAWYRHPRLLVVRADLHFPVERRYMTKRVMIEFWEKFQRCIAADMHKRRSQGVRVHSCRPGYAWVRERHQTLNYHFHVAIFVNYNTYRSVGRFERWEGNLAARIRRAWALAIGLERDGAKGLVHFPENALHILDARAANLAHQYSVVFYRLSYLAKVYSKEFGDGQRNFGASRSDSSGWAM